MKKMLFGLLILALMPMVGISQPNQFRVTKITRNVSTSASGKVHVTRKVVAEAFDVNHHYKLTCVEFTTRYAACPELEPDGLYTVERNGNFVTFTDLVKQPKPGNFASWANYIITFEEG